MTAYDKTLTNAKQRYLVRAPRPISTITFERLCSSRVREDSWESACKSTMRLGCARVLIVNLVHKDDCPCQLIRRLSCLKSAEDQNQTKLRFVELTSNLTTMATVAWERLSSCTRNAEGEGKTTRSRSSVDGELQDTDVVLRPPRHPLLYEVVPENAFARCQARVRCRLSTEQQLFTLRTSETHEQWIMFTKVHQRYTAHRKETAGYERVSIVLVCMRR